MELPQPLYPHQPGITRLAYSPCGKYLLTTGSNMLVRRFPVGEPEIEPDTLDLPQDGLSVDASARDFVVSTRSGLLLIFDLEGNEQRQILARHALPIRHAEFSPDGLWVAAAGDDSLVVTSSNDVERHIRLPEHSGFVKHITFHPGGRYVATSALDGVVRIFELDNEANDDAKKVHEIDSVLPTVRQTDDERTTAVVWSPDGIHFAIPNKTFEVVVFSTKDWLEAGRFSGNGKHVNGLTDIQWSPNGRYLASTDKNGLLVIWDVPKREAIWETPKPITGASQVRWHPHKNELSVTTNEGKLYTFDEVVPTELPPPFGGSITVANKEHNPLLDRKRRLTDQIEADDEDELFVDDSIMQGPHDDAELSATSDLEIEPPAVKRPRFDPIVPREVRAFQSGATPWLDGKRYLCMNTVGSVWTLRQDKDHNSITVEFFNQDIHRELHFHDADQFDLAALGSEALLLANSRTGKVAMRFHDGFSDNWERTFSCGVRSIALSDRVALLCLQNGVLRTFSVFGAPLMVTRSSRDPVVSCAAFENVVMIVRNHAPSGTLTYSLEDAVTGEYWQKDDPVDIAAGDQLTAVLFTETGDPCIMDSTGILSSLLNSRTPGQARWVPIFDTHEAAKDNQRTYWPLAVAGSKLMCVVLKGQQRYPSIPLPLPDEVDLAIPGHSDAQSLEAQYMLGKTLYSQMRSRAEQLLAASGEDDGLKQEYEEELETKELELDRVLLRIFQEACQEKRANRGFDVVTQIRQRESLEAAAKIAVYFGLRTLADRIIEAAE